MLIDELLTARMKLKAFTEANKQTGEIIQRIDQLERVVKRRVDRAHLTINGQKAFNFLTARLAAELQDCWNAQEVMRDWINKSTSEIANAGIQAQITNGHRNELMRELDELLGEGINKPLEKTYA